MGVHHKQGTWWIDWYEGGRRLRKKTRAATKTEARKILEQVRAKQLPRDPGLFDPKLKCAELVTRYLEALKGTRAHHTWRRTYTALRNFFSWCPVKQVSKLASHLVMRGMDLASVKELLGHSTIQMTMRYAHLAREHLRAAMEKMTVPNFREGPSISAGPGFKRAVAK